MIIAIVASNIALIIFFILRKQWEDSPAKIMLCAILLSGAVTSMHYCAAVGTKYFTKVDGEYAGGTSATPLTVVVIVIVSNITYCYAG